MFYTDSSYLSLSITNKTFKRNVFHYVYLFLTTFKRNNSLYLSLSYTIIIQRLLSLSISLSLSQIPNARIDGSATVRAKKKSWYNSLYPTYKSKCEDFKRLFKDLPDEERLIVGRCESFYS